MNKFYKGNLDNDRKKSLKCPKNQREWLIGDFDQFNNSARKTNLLELKYWVIKKGKEKEHSAKVQKTVGEITILLKGKAKGFIGEKDIILKEKDYVYIPPGIVNNLVVKIIDECEEIQGLTIKAPCNKKDFIKILRIR